MLEEAGVQMVDEEEEVNKFGVSALFLVVSACLCDFLCIFLCLCIYLFPGVAHLRRPSPPSVRWSRGSLHLIAGAENLCFLENI